MYKVAQVSFLADCGTEWILEYFLQEYESEESNKVFGVRVNKSTPDGVLVETEETPAISDVREEVLAMAKAFAKGTVPPVTLLEIADEWHSEHLMLPI